MFDPSLPALVLAPMEGVTDAPMRAVQGADGAFTFAVSEFLRVSQTVPRANTFHRHVPELRSAGWTPTGMPVQVQLLGGDPGRMAAAAVYAHEAGANAIDLNFGCPAPTVNRHDGGATLLKHPTRIRDVVRAVREALPPEVPVSAKLRLGWDRTESVHENAAMAAEGGAAWLTIHARTRTQGYAPPVFWPHIGAVRERLGIPVVANGDIWTLADFRRCRDETGCRHFMLGRGALADPMLARRIAAELGLVPRASEPTAAVDWPVQIRGLLAWTRYYGELHARRSVFRVKQWLRLAAVYGDFRHFDEIKLANSTEKILAILGEQAAVA